VQSTKRIIDVPRLAHTSWGNLWLFQKFSESVYRYPDKRSIGTTHRGFDFLGYCIHPDRKLRPALQSLNRLLVRSRRLYEQGVDENRLRQYVQRWFTWLHSGLRNRVTGGFNRIWLFVLKYLNIRNKPSPD
jgi:hypothetical protein